MLPRILRVVRAKAIRKTALASQNSRPDSRNPAHSNKERIYNPKMSSQASSLQGRAGKLLGRAGAAQFKKREGAGSGANETAVGRRGQGERTPIGSGIAGISKTPEKVIFEGYRANSGSGRPKDLKLGGGGGGKKSGKPRTRNTKRASEWKKGGGKKK
jgi:nucleolar protein 12